MPSSKGASSSSGKKQFTHLHVHTEYSLLDGVSRISPLIAKVKEDGQNAISMTDHGVMYGLFEFWSKCNEEGLKPIIGVEAYLSPRDRTIRKPIDGIKYYHLILLAKNKNGYKNLLKIVSEAHLSGFYYRPRVDKALLEQFSDDIICTSACMGGPLGRHILRGEADKAGEWIDFMKKTFDNNFYIEIQRYGPDGTDDVDTSWKDNKTPYEYDFARKQAKINKAIIKMAKEFDVPLVATADAHYLNKEDRETQEVLFAIKDGRTIEDESRRRGYPETYIKTREEMYKLFSDLPEALENTQKIAESVEKYDITYKRIQPEYKKIENNKNVREYLKELSYKGIEERYGEITKELKERADFELQIIHDKGYDHYFLVVWDYVKFAREKGILVGPGRGSGAGSIIAYALRITNIDPIGWELYFERFLNPERESPPDFDIDFQDDRRDELFKYMENEYGIEQTSNICAIGRMKTRAAIRDVSRVMDIDLSIADRLSKLVMVKFGRVASMEDMIKSSSEFRNIIKSSDELVKMSEVVKKIEGMARHISTHACGYLVTPDPIVNYVPIQKDTKETGARITQIEGYSLEPMGLMKFDFLGLSNLTLIKNITDAIEQHRGEKVKIDDIPFDDKKTFELFQRGETTAIFQFENDVMKKYLQELHPQHIEDLSFLTAAYRPGPMKYIPDYIKRKFGKQKIEYIHDDLKPILETTYGFAIYQEQVIRIAVDIAGYSMGEADMLRRAMGKKKPEVMAKEKEKFLKGCKDKGYTKKIAEEIFSYLEPFADYGFNKAHSASYAVIAYWTAYFKANYPIEFLVGLMETDIDNSEKLSRDFKECDRIGIEILPPDINKSCFGFVIEGDKSIRYGLMGLKNVSRSSIEEIIKERENGEYKDIDDLFERVDITKVDKKTIEILIKVGAFDQWGERAQFLEIFKTLFERQTRLNKNAANGQAGLFDNNSSGTDNLFKTPLPKVKKISDSDKLNWEKDYMGVYLTDHPISKFTTYFKVNNILSVKDVLSFNDEKLVKVGAIITDTRKIFTKKDRKMMLFCSIEDLDNKIDGVIFPKVYEEYREDLLPNKPYIIEGSLNFRNDEKSILVNKLKMLDEDAVISIDSATNEEIDLMDRLETSDKICLKIPKNNKGLSLVKLKKVLVSNPGPKKVILEVANGGSKTKILNLQSGLAINLEVARTILPYIQELT